MDFYDNLLDDSHYLLRETCRKFAEKEILPFAAEWEEEEIFPRELYEKAAKAGVLGVGFPEEIGGAGGGTLHAIMSLEGLLRGGSTGVVVGLTSLGIGLPAIIQSENEKLIEKYVKPVLRGEKISALAITEPNTGSDVSGVRTSARREGDHYIINGAKLFITSGVRADYFTVLARTSAEPHQGLTFFVIEKEFPGVMISRALKKTGWRASDTAEIVFDGVKVPIENRLGEEGSGFLTLMRNFQTERISLAAIGCATAQIALDETIRYTKERKAFGKSIVGFQVTRHKLAEMATRIAVATSMTYQVAARMDQGDYVVKEVSMAKNFAAETAVWVCYEAVQLHGGMGYMRETLVERLSRDARLLPIGGGTQEVMKEIIAKGLDL